MNAPKRIWVDTCKDADGEPEWDTGAWSLNQEQEDDKEYVRADLFAKAVWALREIYGDGNATGYNPQWMTNTAAKVLAELEGK